METIKLPTFEITITHESRDKNGASITSNLKATPETNENMEFNAAMDGVESMVLAHFCAGIDVSSPAYLEGIETAVNAAGQSFS